MKDFDITEYIDSDEAVAEYLDQVFKDGDLAEIRRAIGYVAKARGMTSVAAQSGVSRAALYKALDVQGNPSFNMVLNVLHAFGVRLSVTH